MGMLYQGDCIENLMAEHHRRRPKDKWFSANTIKWFSAKFYEVAQLGRDRSNAEYIFVASTRDTQRDAKRRFTVHKMDLTGNITDVSAWEEFASHATATRRYKQELQRISESHETKQTT